MQVLNAVRKGRFVDHAFEHAAAPLGDADRRLAQELSYGVLRLRGRLDFVIAELVEGGLGRLEADVLDVLRLAAYQLLELERVPPYAAVSEAVEAAKRTAGKGAASLTNAVLRRLSHSSYTSFTFPRLEEDPLGYLESWGSHPRWMVERWLARWPAGDVRRLVDYNNQRPPVYLSVAREREEAVRRLHEAGLEAETVEHNRCSIRLKSGDPKRALEQIEAVVQDPGAAAVVDYMALEPAAEVVDLCAAPGGKAALLASRGHEIWAIDVARTRLARLLENRDRLGLSRLHVLIADSTRPPIRAARAVLLDAPCSGTGTLSRHPDGRWRLRPGDLEVLADLQRRLLDAAADLVAPYGILVYATCSLEREENEDQVESFLSRRADFVLDGPPELPEFDRFLGSEGQLSVLPQRDGMDGAYAARLRRRAG
jgi:16S rRNA (cytosine967-C5)-methyltransferase